MDNITQDDFKKSIERGHEQRDVSLRVVVWSVVGLAVLCIITFVSMALMFNFLEASRAESQPEPLPLAETDHLPPLPRLQVEPEMDLKEFHAAEDLLLNSYGWVSKEAGVVHIPIESAIEMVLEKGFPVRDQEDGK